MRFVSAVSDNAGTNLDLQHDNHTFGWSSGFNRCSNGSSSNGSGSRLGVPPISGIHKLLKPCVSAAASRCFRTYPTPMTCPISCNITPSNVPLSSMLAMSSMSNRMLPKRLIVRHSFQISFGPAEPRTPPTPSISSSVVLIRRRPAGIVSVPPQGTWVITSDHLHGFVIS